MPFEHPNFHRPGYIDAPIFVFPRNSIWIQYEYQEAFVSDTSLVNFYNAGQMYWRDLIHPKGDDCYWFAVSPEIISEIVGKSEHPETLFQFRNISCGRQTFVQHLRVLELLGDGVIDVQLQVEEQVLNLLKALIEPVTETQKHTVSAKAQHRRLIGQVKQSLQSSLNMNLSLQQLAAQHHVSPFHLSRLFKKVCGYGISTYRNQQRMRAAAICISQGEDDLASLALNLGYSSHSHLTAAFKQYYGCPPRHFQQSAL